MVEDFVPFADYIGILAGLLVLYSFIPQLHKAYKTKRMLDVSIYLMATIASGMLLWVLYGIIRRDLVIIGSNVSGFGLNVILLILKLKYDKLQKT